MSYNHFTIDERESIHIYHMQGLNFLKLLSYFIVILPALVGSGSDIQNQEVILPTKHKHLINLQNHTVGERKSLK
ncbi:hypothetical protein D8796_06485 [Streptococcus cristatus]|uniref:Uncharacterized protein n=1 Tax=Streptococcus cristatus TaxID=45634 RepID=A0A428GTM3_STRCR|nr:hypothetical protein D8796_06485 [Streptococcus cristatus]RSJ81719.1 hypothetical protein D8795_00500 [Streptococcus cristatus]RSJ85671.1 hypothetical protein D8794_06125 [Streptococcus cristatus]RSJ86785.1 hypothetical protein D8793_02905 [Streptococcus cristatus]